MGRPEIPVISTRMGVAWVPMTTVLPRGLRRPPQRRKDAAVKRRHSLAAGGGSPADILLPDRIGVRIEGFNFLKSTAFPVAGEDLPESRGPAAGEGGGSLR